MKKMIALLLSATMLLSLAGCGTNEVGTSAAEVSESTSSEASQTANTEPVTITWNVYETDNLTMEYWQTIVDMFEKDNPDIHIELVINPEGSGGRSVWQKTQLAAGTLPDIVVDAAIIGSEPGVFLEMPEDLKATFEDGVLVAVDGKYSLIPSDVQYRMQVYYNKALFEQAGAEVPTTWEEFLDVCQKLQDADIVPLMCAGSATAWACLGTYWISNSNSELYDYNPNFLADIGTGTEKWNNECLQKSFHALVDNVIEKGYFYEGAMSYDYARASEEFDKGTAAMMLDGSWRAAGYDTAGNTDFGCFVLPNVAGVKTYPTLNHYWGVNAECKNPEAAWTFVKYVLGGNPDCYKFLLEGDGLYPATIEKPEMDTGSVMGEYMENYKDMTLIPELANTYGDGALPSGMMSVIQTEMVNLFTGEKTVDQVLDAMQTEYDALVEN